MGIFKVELTSEQIESRIESFDKVTESLNEQLAKATDAVRKAHEQMAIAAATGEGGIGRGELKKLQSEKSELMDELSGRESARALLQEELSAAEIREEVQDLEAKAEEGRKVCGSVGKVGEKIVAAFAELVAAVDEFAKLAVKIPGSYSAGHDRPGASIAIPIAKTFDTRGSLIDAATASGVEERVGWAVEQLDRDLEAWKAKQMSGIHSRHGGETP
jgi:hypothetical protein